MSQEEDSPKKDSAPNQPTGGDRVNQPVRNPYSQACARYVRAVTALLDTYPLLASILHYIVEESNAAMNVVLEQHSAKVEEKPGSYKVPGDWLPAYHSVQQRFTNAAETVEQLPKTITIALVSEFDALVGKLISSYLQDKPEAVNASERKFTLAELRTVGSVEDAAKFIIEKEVETVLRKSHTEHFDWLENKLGINLRKDLAVWPKFIEVTERRNLLVHTGGVVSAQYIEVCKKHGVPSHGVKAGDQLQTTPTYLFAARDVMLEMAIKLAQVVWRKLRPTETEVAEQELLRCTYELLKHGHYQVVVSVLSFFVYGLKWASEQKRLTCAVNLAQAYKWMGDPDSCKKVIAEFASDVLAPKWQLAKHVLKEEFEAASKIVKESGEGLEVSIDDYVSWPLFRDFRKSEFFRTAFRDRFGRAWEDYEKMHTSRHEDLMKKAATIVREQSSKAANNDKPADSAGAAAD